MDVPSQTAFSSNALSTKCKYSYNPSFGGAPALCCFCQDWVERMKDSLSSPARGRLTQDEINQGRYRVKLHVAVRVLGSWPPQNIEDYVNKHLLFDEVVIDLKKQALQDSEDTALRNFWSIYPQIHLSAVTEGKVLVRTNRVTDCCMEFSSECEARVARLLKWEPSTPNDVWECNLSFRGVVYGAIVDYSQLLQRKDAGTSEGVFVLCFCVDDASKWPSIFPMIGSNNIKSNATAAAAQNSIERDRSRLQPSEWGSHGF